MHSKLTKSKNTHPISKWSEYLFDKKHTTPDDCWYFKNDIAFDLEIMIKNLAHKIKVDQNCTTDEAHKTAINLIMEQLLPLQRIASSNTQKAMIFSIFFDSPDLEDIRKHYFSHIENTENNQKLLNGEPLKKKKSFFSFLKSKDNTPLKKNDYHFKKDNFAMKEEPNYKASQEQDSLAKFIEPVKFPEKFIEPPQLESKPIPPSPTKKKVKKVKKNGFFSFFTRKKTINPNYEHIKNRARQ